MAERRGIEPRGSLGLIVQVGPAVKGLAWRVTQEQVGVVQRAVEDILGEPGAAYTYDVEVVPDDELRGPFGPMGVPR